MRREWEAGRAVWKVVLVGWEGSLEVRESRLASSKVRAGDTTPPMGFSSSVFARLQSSTFKAEIPAYRTRQVLSFLIRQEESGRGNGESFPCQEVGEAQRRPRFLAKKNEKVVLTPVLAQSTEKGPGGREQDKSPTPAPSH